MLASRSKLEDIVVYIAHDALKTYYGHLSPQQVQDTALRSLESFRHSNKFSTLQNVIFLSLGNKYSAEIAAADIFHQLGRDKEVPEDSRWCE